MSWKWSEWSLDMSDNQKINELVSQSTDVKLSVEEEQQINDELLNVSTLSDSVRSQLLNTVAKVIQENLGASGAGVLHNSGIVPLSDPFEDFSAPEDFKEIVIRFQRIRKLASGGIGEVWVSRDEKLGRSVVIKELNAIAKESPQSLDRFQREAEITGLLEHPNIVPLYLYGVDRRTAEPFYAMRFVGQRNLENAIEEHHDRVEAGQSEDLSLHRLLNIFLDICQAIAYAHSRGVIHRDLKPENIAIDNFGQVIVLDWGLAKLMAESELALKLNETSNMTDSSLMHTAHGQVIGTPVYMSPEQASGNIDLIDTRTDVYGLGAILFAILTGKPPHLDLVTDEKSGFTEVISQIADAPTPMPSDFSNVPAGLEAICVRALSRKRHLRFDAVTELAEAVEKWMVGQSGKKVGYEKLRMEGRELRADMQSRVHDLERNVRFCSSLPPVQELINAETDEDQKVWRQRMATLLTGMMEANPGYHSLVYARFEGDSYSEIVRVEKQKGPTGAVRTTPRSRLETRKQNHYLQELARQLPGESQTSMVCQSGAADGCFQVGLQSGIPIYDRDTEEVYGFIVATCDIYRLLEQQLSRRHTASEIVVVCDTFDILSHKRDGQMICETRRKTVADMAPVFKPAMDHLRSNLDFIDDAKSETYGARIFFETNKNGLMFLLKR